MDQPSRPSAASEFTGSLRQRRSWQAMATRFDVELVGADAEHLGSGGRGDRRRSPAARSTAFAAQSGQRNQPHQSRAAAVGPRGRCRRLAIAHRSPKSLPPGDRRVFRCYGRGAQRHAAADQNSRRAAVAARRRTANRPVLADRRGHRSGRHRQRLRPRSGTQDSRSATASARPCSVPAPVRFWPSAGRVPARAWTVDYAIRPTTTLPPSIGWTWSIAVCLVRPRSGRGKRFPTLSIRTPGLPLAGDGRGGGAGPRGRRGRGPVDGPVGDGPRPGDGISCPLGVE